MAVSRPFDPAIARWPMAAVLVSAPIFVAWREGTLWAADCSSVGALKAIVGVAPVTLDGCTSIPLALDIPSIGLGLSCVLAVLLIPSYLISLSELDGELVRTGLRARGSEPLVSFRAVPRPTVMILLAASLTLVGVWFHAQVSANYPLQRLLHSGQHGAPTPPLGWWAGAESGGWSLLGLTVSAWVWVLVGVIGSAAALWHAYLDVRLSHRLRSDNLNFEAKYLFSAQDGQHGWAPFSKLMSLTALGAANFGLAFFAIFFMLVGPQAGRTVLATVTVVAVVGVFANYVTLRALWKFVDKRHEEAWAREYARRPPKRGRWFQSKRRRALEERLEVSELRSVLLQERGFPLGGVWRRTPEILVAAVANLGLLVAMIKTLVNAL